MFLKLSWGLRVLAILGACATAACTSAGPDSAFDGVPRTAAEYAALDQQGRAAANERADQALKATREYWSPTGIGGKLYAAGEPVVTGSGQRTTYMQWVRSPTDPAGTIVFWASNDPDGIDGPGTEAYLMVRANPDGTPARAQNGQLLVVQGATVNEADGLRFAIENGTRVLTGAVNNLGVGLLTTLANDGCGSNCGTPIVNMVNAGATALNSAVANTEANVNAPVCPTCGLLN